MTISAKVLEKAVEKKDSRFLAAKLAEKLREYDWSSEDIRELAQRIEEQAE